MPAKPYQPNTQKHSLALSLCYAASLLIWIFTVEKIASQNLFWGPFHDSAHAVAFFLLVLCINSFMLHIGKLEDRLGFRLALIGSGCFLGGILIELVQPLLNRSSSMADIIYNFAGITAALITIVSKHKHTIYRLALFCIALSLLISAFFIPIYGAFTLSKRNELFPVLLDFEHSWQTQLYRANKQTNASLISQPSGWENDSTTLKIDFIEGKYPGFSIPHIAPNWSSYDTLQFEVFSSGSTTRHLTLRVHDLQHDHSYSDRFNKTFQIQPGLNTISVLLSDIQSAPATRVLDLNRIAGVALFSSAPRESFSLYFDNLRLSKKH